MDADADADGWTDMALCMKRLWDVRIYCGGPCYRGVGGSGLVGGGPGHGGYLIEPGILG